MNAEKPPLQEIENDERKKITIETDDNGETTVTVWERKYQVTHEDAGEAVVIANNLLPKKR